MTFNPKQHLFRAEGVVVLIMAIGYLGLTFYSLWKWNEAVSGALITGFALFAQKAIADFFALVNSEANRPDPATTIISTTQSQQSKPAVAVETKITEGATQ